MAMSVIAVAMGTCVIAFAAPVFTNNRLVNHVLLNNVIVWLYCSALVCVCCYNCCIIIIGTCVIAAVCVITAACVIAAA